MKIIEFMSKLWKSWKSKNSMWELKKNENHRMDNHVNHENLRIQFENNENHENQRIPRDNKKNAWKSCYSSRY